MLKSYFDISDKNAPIYDEREEVFKKKVFDLFGIKVIQSHYQTGNIREDVNKRQNYLTVWCDFSSSKIIFVSGSGCITGSYGPYHFRAGIKVDIYISDPNICRI